jgi:hypothetical protein
VHHLFITSGIPRWTTSIFLRMSYGELSRYSVGRLTVNILDIVGRPTVNCLWVLSMKLASCKLRVLRCILVLFERFVHPCPRVPHAQPILYSTGRPSNYGLSLYAAWRFIRPNKPGLTSAFFPKAFTFLLFPERHDKFHSHKASLTILHNLFLDYKKKWQKLHKTILQSQIRTTAHKK